MRIGLAPFKIIPGKPSCNLWKMESIVSKASKARCDLVVFPEMCDTGENTDRIDKLLGLARAVPGESSDFVSFVAKAFSIDIAAGLLERDGNDVYSSAVYISSEGSILHRHRQISNGFPYKIGFSFEPFATRHGSAIFAICGDLFLDTFFASVEKSMPKLIIVPMDFCRDDDEPEGTLPRFLPQWMNKFSQASTLSRSTLVAVNAMSDTVDGWAGACGGAYVFENGCCIAQLDLHNESLLIAEM